MLYKNYVEKYARQIVKDNFDNAGLTKIRKIGYGSYGFVYELKLDKHPHTVALKVFRIKGQCLKEVNALKTLKPYSTIPIPEVYQIIEATDTFSYDVVLMQMMPGKNAFLDYLFKTVSKKKREAFARECVKCLLKIHAVKNPTYGPIENPAYDSWLDFYKEKVDRIYYGIVAKYQSCQIDRDLFELVKKSYEMFGDIFKEPVKEASLIHGDFNVMNILVDPQTFNPTALIDPLNTMYADKEFELHQLRNMTGDRYNLYELYKQEAQCSRLCDLKSAFYSLFHEMDVFLDTDHLYKYVLRKVVRIMKEELWQYEHTDKYQTI